MIILLYLSVIGIIVGEMLVVVVLVPGYTLAIDSKLKPQINLHCIYLRVVVYY